MERAYRAGRLTARHRATPHPSCAPRPALSPLQAECHKHHGRVVIPWQRVEKSYPTHSGITAGGPMVDDPTAAGPLRVQGDHDEVAYRNIWYKPLSR